ncbi:cytochrome P450 [Streptomyces sp. NPDC088725]|uniref:cytochrome P450 n=1 Tax=Streptomyces sp. NPDC088725 TaxID=3365873 RepID=UPI00381DC400
MPTEAAPAGKADLFADDVLHDPYPLYATLRETAPAVWLEQHDVWAVTRHADVKAALGDPETFSSVDGLALTEAANSTIMRGTVLGSDGADHARLRRPLSRQLNPRAMRDLVDRVRDRADRLVAGCIGQGCQSERAPLGEQDFFQGEFDAALLAQRFVADIVMELMGLPESTREKLIHGAAATFDMFGPDNDRFKASAPTAGAMIEFLYQEVTRESVAPGSWMAAIYAAADAGELDEADVVPLMSAYTAAGMDTTIDAISGAIHRLATHPEQWEHLRAGRADGEDVFRETMRLDAPIQAFGRRATRDTSIDGVPIAAGEQVWLIFGATGRDPRKWGPDAEEFRVRRPDTADHLALGYGPHTCAGNHLAALEARSLLESLAAHCTRLEPAGEPVRTLNNVLHGWRSVPVRVTAA